ncbi:hypothetical protein [Ohessyouella blattaphilus]|uniref:Uncharacterized protein n=1 Tax=Ohessyouella blattaphilus TaxID=2949333 RepID=A0ABT1EFZ9_9FIRM|nr:hypothetical protein [Ohessyouella blattaphilus]MCP1109431.1 hypothetical protein [Ohessyouella blattaphilus]MCR8562825.1 hypothetical protein [Ohessyouella blattaphilus]
MKNKAIIISLSGIALNIVVWCIYLFVNSGEMNMMVLLLTVPFGIVGAISGGFVERAFPKIMLMLVNILFTLSIVYPFIMWALMGPSILQNAM